MIGLNELRACSAVQMVGTASCCICQVSEYTIQTNALHIKVVTGITAARSSYSDGVVVRPALPMYLHITDHFNGRRELLSMSDSMSSFTPDADMPHVALRCGCLSARSP